MPSDQGYWTSDYVTGNPPSLSYVFRWNCINSPFVRFERSTTNPTGGANLQNKSYKKYTFNPTKTYIWKTEVANFNDESQLPAANRHTSDRKISISPPYKPGATFSWQWAYTTSFGFPITQTPFPNAFTLPIDEGNITPTHPQRNTLIFIDRPSAVSKTLNRVNYRASNTNFGSYGITTNNCGIIQSNLIEIDWLIQGYSCATSSQVNFNQYYEGWRYNEDDESFLFMHSSFSTKRWPLSLAINQTSGSLNGSAVAGITGHLISTSFKGATGSNFISRYIPSQNFNLSLTKTTMVGAGEFLKIYLFKDEPIITKRYTDFEKFLNTGQLVATIITPGSYDFYNLTGEGYLTFVAEYNDARNHYEIKISDIKIVEGYSQIENNEQLLLTNSDIYQDPTTLSVVNGSLTSTYSAIAVSNKTLHHSGGNDYYGAIGATGSFGPYFSNYFNEVVNLSEIYAKAGNGKFKAGIWENGVWNNGLRIDDNTHQFDDIDLAIKMSTENVSWRIQISGSTFSTTHFEIGDKVSISNIIAIDINDKRKTLKNYFTIVNKTDTKLIVELTNVFPIRRIEKDSENHKILITKNVWLNGGFLNGYFEGIWNDGLFKGYPYITEMYNTHWIDGTFNGGHFNSIQPQYTFVDTYFWNGNVGLTFGATAHGLLPGDEVIIDKFDKTVNASYDGLYKITEVIDDYLAITDVPWGVSTPTGTEGGEITKKDKTSLVQNFRFYDNNVSNKTTKTSGKTSEIYRYNSWMDLTFVTQSSTNLGSQKILTNAGSNNINEVLTKQKFGIGDYTALNLYGYITNDVLSSESEFRDSETLFKRNYSLGTKWEVYKDFLGNLSEFNNPFDTETKNLDNFYADGWTFSFLGIHSTYSYINKFIKNKSASSNILSYDRNILYNSSHLSGIPNPIVTPTTSPIWQVLSFNNAVENDFGSLITEIVPNSEFKVLTSGKYSVSVDLPLVFTTKAYSDQFTSTDNVYFELENNIIVGQIRLVKWNNQTSSYTTLITKNVKTTSGDYIIGVEKYDEGDNDVEYSENLNVNLSWVGQVNINDKFRVEFQRCSSDIMQKSAGPWRLRTDFFGSEYISEVINTWSIGTSSSINIFNSGEDESLGFKLQRTANKTLQYQSDNEISFFTLNNTNIDIEKNRYSIVEFDILQQPDSILNVTTLGDESFQMQFHTIDLYNFTNIINSDLTYGGTHSFPGGYDPLIHPYSSTFSIYSTGIDYKYTGKNTVTEYFYNRPGLDLGLLNYKSDSVSNGESNIHEIDNVKFYEVDMIPFFQYTTEDFVNKQIQTPYVGKAPFIDYSDEGFLFVNNITIGLDAIIVDSNGVVIASNNNNTENIVPSSQNLENQ